jgi:hypothetical protein
MFEPSGVVYGAILKRTNLCTLFVQRYFSVFSFIRPTRRFITAGQLRIFFSAGNIFLGLVYFTSVISLIL